MIYLSRHKWWHNQRLLASSPVFHSISLIKNLVFKPNSSAWFFSLVILSKNMISRGILSTTIYLKKDAPRMIIYTKYWGNYRGLERRELLHIHWFVRKMLPNYCIWEMQSHEEFYLQSKNIKVRSDPFWPFECICNLSIVEKWGIAGYMSRKSVYRRRGDIFGSNGIPFWAHYSSSGNYLTA